MILDNPWTALCVGSELSDNLWMFCWKELDKYPVDIVSVGRPSTSTCPQQSHTSWNISINPSRLIYRIDLFSLLLTVIHLVVPLYVGNHTFHVDFTIKPRINNYETVKRSYRSPANNKTGQLCSTQWRYKYHDAEWLNLQERYDHLLALLPQKKEILFSPIHVKG